MVSLDVLPRAVAIEFPLNVKNQDKAIEAVGGASGIKKAVDNPDEKLELRLRSDRFHHPINAKRMDFTHVVLEISLPKSALDAANGDVRAALASCPKNKYSIKPALFVDTTYRFREMADFQYNTENHPLIEKLEKTVINADLREIEKMEPSEHVSWDLLPPPRFSQQSQPVFYQYKQPSSVSVVQDYETGNTKLVNRNVTKKQHSEVLSWGDPVPSGPPPDIDINPHSGILKCKEQIEKLFENRPCWTRRGLAARIDPELRRYLRYALPYLAYFCRSGPWRAGYIKYGSDPAKDKSLAIYQVEHFRILGEDLPATDEIITDFNGHRYPTSRMLQLVDITEPFLRNMIDQAQLRRTVDKNDGWYSAVDMYAIRKVLRDELVNARHGNAMLSNIELRDKADEARKYFEHLEKHRAASSGRAREETLVLGVGGDEIEVGKEEDDDYEDDAEETAERTADHHDEDDPMGVPVDEALRDL